jgi:TRAP-type C4-dicarboxylate transport system permease small subunit
VGVARVLAGADRAIRALEAVGAGISLVAFCLIALIIVVDVVLRYAFNAPLGWSTPLIGSYLMVAAYFAVASSAQRRRGNVSMESVVRLFPTRVRTFASAVGGVLALAFCALVVAAISATAVQAFQQRQTLGGLYQLAVWPPLALAALGYTLLCARIALEVLQESATLLGVRGVLPHAEPLGESVRGIE